MSQGKGWWMESHTLGQEEKKKRQRIIGRKIKLSQLAYYTVPFPTYGRNM
jgi:hypothetical protein